MKDVLVIGGGPAGSTAATLLARKGFSVTLLERRREFLEVFLQPSTRFGLIRPIVGVLAGDVFAGRRNRLKLELFFALVRLQKRFGVIAPRIEWDSLPTAATV